ncbi:MAG TPA: hypothetical protein VFB71_12270 [Ramlibacter sp.]|nr:hypothetical protein [Ramlibacter sp.]
MGEQSEYFDAAKAEHRERAAARRLEAPAKLTALHLEYVSRNNGAHLIVKHGRRWIDYWPGTCRWCERRSKNRGWGLRSLLVSLGVVPAGPTTPAGQDGDDGTG